MKKQKERSKEKEKSTEEILNYDNYKEAYTSHKKTIRHMIKSFIKKCPRETLIDILKELKIIKIEWDPKTDRLVPAERGK